MIRLDIVTPEKKAFSSDGIEMVVLPATEGEIAVLANHAPLVTTLAPGELRYKKGEEEVSLAVGAGIVEVTRGSVSVLTDMAMCEDEIDESVVEKALESANQALADGGSGDPEEMAVMMANIQRQMAQLQVKRKRRSI